MKFLKSNEKQNGKGVIFIAAKCLLRLPFNVTCIKVLSDLIFYLVPFRCSKHWPNCHGNFYIFFSSYHNGLNLKKLYYGDSLE